MRRVALINLDLSGVGVSYTVKLLEIKATRRMVVPNLRS